MHVQERAAIGGGTPAGRPRGELPDGVRATSCSRLQPASQPRDAGRQPAAERDAQFEHINCKNGGREWQIKGEPEQVRIHDFAIRQPDKGKVAPYGVYELGRNVGWVSVGVDHDTAAFAVESIRRWWRWMGRPSYPNAKQLLITADSGGSNGARVRLWKWELQRFADETGLQISVCHLPPGTSKWNKIEHRLFSFISQNWRGKPLISHEVIINLIAATTSKTGLAVRSELNSDSGETLPMAIGITNFCQGVDTLIP